MTAIERAHRNLQKLRESGKWCCITIFSDYHYVWEISLTRSSRKRTGKHKPCVHVQAETFPELIRKAVKDAKVIP